MLTRRNILLGLITAPVIIKYSHLMPVKGLVSPVGETLSDGAIYAKVSQNMLLPGLWTVQGMNQFNEWVTLRLND